MAQDKQFVDGLSFKPPRDNAPEFVKGTGSINRQRMIEFLQSKQEDWVNFDILTSQKGGWYAQVNTWKPDVSKTAPSPALEGDDAIW